MLKRKKKKKKKNPCHAQIYLSMENLETCSPNYISRKMCCSPALECCQQTSFIWPPLQELTQLQRHLVKSHVLIEMAYIAWTA